MTVIFWCDAKTAIAKATAEKAGIPCTDIKMSECDYGYWKTRLKAVTLSAITPL